MSYFSLSTKPLKDNGLKIAIVYLHEKGTFDGLGVIDSEVRGLDPEKCPAIPHMGWNSLKYPNEGRLFRGIPEDSYVYFVHSYYLKAKDDRIVKATTEYGTHIHASVEQDNIFACQFHPEKSSTVGLKILENFAGI